MILRKHSSYRILICPALLALLAGCASSLNVRTEPKEATVSIVPAQAGAALKLVGKTPLSVGMADLKRLYGEELPSGKSLELVIEKRGYVTQHYLVPATPFSTLSTVLDARLKEGPPEDQAATEVLAGIFQAQKFGIQGDFDRGIVEVDKILAIYPRFAPALSMKASILFMKKNYNESLGWYEKALAANSGSQETVEMITYIRGLLKLGPETPGTRAPAGGKN